MHGLMPSTNLLITLATAHQNPEKFMAGRTAKVTAELALTENLTQDLMENLTLELILERITMSARAMNL